MNQKRIYLPYWVNPYIIISIIVAFSLLLYFLTDKEAFSIVFKQTKYGNYEAAFLYMYSLVLFLVGCGVAVVLFRVSKTRHVRNASAEADRVIRIVAWSSIGLAILGYAVYFGSSKASIDVYLMAISGKAGATYTLKNSFEKVPGITSFMNLACWWYVYVVHEALIKNNKLNMNVKLVTMLITTLCLLRAFAVNERRVVIEIAVPAIIYFVFCYRNWNKSTVRSFALAPVIGVACLCLLFLVSEYFRSWVNFYSDGRSGMTYIDWALTRLGGYYTTAINNSVTLVESGFRSQGIITFSGLMKMPLISEFLGSREAREIIASDYKMALYTLTNPEFNSPGGITAPILDFGYMAGGGIIFIYGVFCQLIYRKAATGDLFSILMYGNIFFGLLEGTRMWFVLSANSVINIIFLILIFQVSAFLKPASRAER